MTSATQAAVLDPGPARGTAAQVTHLSKTFNGVPALSDVDLNVRTGEVHALLGGNGSGKSTLIKILAGVYTADPAGTVQVGDHRTAAEDLTPRWARRAGLVFVHQDPAIIPALTVAENFALVWGFPTGPAGIRSRLLRRRASEALRPFDLDLDIAMPASQLRPAQRVLVAICRALADVDPEHSASSSRVLVLDEPTAALPAVEVDVLLRAIRRQAERGLTVLYVTHRLDEVPVVADRVTVLRDGAVVAAGRPVRDLGERELLTLIAGRELDAVYPPAGERADGAVVLAARSLSGGRVADLDLDVHAGEVLGVAGLVGSGRSTLLRLLFGLQARTGQVLLDGEPLAANPGTGSRAGLAFVPENRADEGVFPDLSVRENLSPTWLRRYWRGLLRSRAERADARSTVARFGIRTAGVELPVAALSGGNQQKVILARWLARSPRVLLLDEPTQGVDVGARADIYRLVRDAADRGAAVVVASSDPDELVNLCDRVVILSAGRVVADGLRHEVDHAWLLSHAYAGSASRDSTAPAPQPGAPG